MSRYDARIIAAALYHRPPLAEAERLYAVAVLASCGGNVSAAARRLEISRDRLYRIIARTTGRGRYRAEPELPALEVG